MAPYDFNIYLTTAQVRGLLSSVAISHDAGHCTWEAKRIEREQSVKGHGKVALLPQVVATAVLVAGTGSVKVHRWSVILDYEI